MSGNNVVDGEGRGAAVEGLTAKDAAEGAVVLAADLCDNGVHGPAVQLVVAEDLERKAVLHLVALDRLGSVSVV